MGKLSEKARVWLELLRDDGPQPHAGRGNMPCSMRRKGFTEFVLKSKASGLVLSTAEADAMFRDGRSREISFTGLDRITPAGRVALKEPTP